MVFDSFFKHHQAKLMAGKQAVYANGADFMANNIAMVKTILSFTGFNDPDRRLANIAQIAKCRVMALCKLDDDQDRFTVVKSTNEDMCKVGQSFTWQHILPWGSTDASAAAPLPFRSPDCPITLSVPVKDDRNILAGVVIGLSMDRTIDIDTKLQVMHLLTPPLEAEIRCIREKEENRQLSQRIAALNQNIEVLNTDLDKERKIATESRNLKSAFLTNLSHEIRTPMNAIIGFMNLVQNAKEPKERDEFIEIMRQNCHQLLYVIDSLIDISKLQSNYMLKPPCPVQLNELLSEVKQKYAALLRREGKAVDIETSFALETPNDTIWNSDEIINKVMCILMDNACKHTTSGRITISYSINHKEATFCVADTGPGVPQDEANGIFDLFAGGGVGTHTAEAHGKGSGLAIASRYLALANGRIWLDTSYRSGACFYFSIPTEKL